MAARAAGVKQGLTQNRNELVIGTHHHAGMAIIAGPDGKGHGDDHTLLSSPPLHKAKGEIAMRTAQPRLHAVEFQEYVTDAVTGRKIVARVRHRSKMPPTQGE